MKFVPVMRMIWPPSGRPRGGEIDVIVGTTGQSGFGGVHGAMIWKLTSMKRVMLLTVAVTRATTGVDEVRCTTATPFSVVRMSACTAGVTSVNVPLFVVNSTAVPFGAGCPFSVTVAVMVTVLSTNGV